MRNDENECWEVTAGACKGHRIFSRVVRWATRGSKQFQELRVFGLLGLTTVFLSRSLYQIRHESSALLYESVHSSVGKIIGHEYHIILKLPTFRMNWSTWFQDVSRLWPSLAIKWAIKWAKHHIARSSSPQSWFGSGELRAHHRGPGSKWCRSAWESRKKGVNSPEIQIGVSNARNLPGISWGSKHGVSETRRQRVRNQETRIQCSFQSQVTHSHTNGISPGQMLVWHVPQESNLAGRRFMFNGKTAYRWK